MSTEQRKTTCPHCGQVHACGEVEWQTRAREAKWAPLQGRVAVCECGTGPHPHYFGAHPDCEYFAHHCDTCHERQVCTRSECAMLKPAVTGEEHERAEVRILALTMALKRFGMHAHSCAVHAVPCSKPCNCGLQYAIEPTPEGLARIREVDPLWIDPSTGKK